MKLACAHAACFARIARGGRARKHALLFVLKLGKIRVCGKLGQARRAHQPATLQRVMRLGSSQGIGWMASAHRSLGIAAASKPT